MRRKPGMYLPDVSCHVVQHGNNLVYNMDYGTDNDYRINDLDLGSIIDRTYSYVNTGNIQSITNNLNASKTQTFTYDNMDRLDIASGDYGNRDYDWDLSGNIEEATLDGTVADFRYDDPTSHRLKQVVTGGSAYNFNQDSNGNTTLRYGVPHSYGPDGRRSSQGYYYFGYYIATHAYLYNALGQRIYKVTATTVTQYQYDLEGHLIAEINILDQNGDLDHTGKEYAYLGDQPLATWHVEDPMPVLASPSFDPVGGTFIDSVTVTLSHPSPGATIYYSFDGGVTVDEYTGPITMTQTENLTTAAVQAFNEVSTYATETYTIAAGASGSGGGGSMLQGQSSPGATTMESSPVSEGPGVIQKFGTAGIANKVLEKNRAIISGLRKKLQQRDSSGPPMPTLDVDDQRGL